MRLVDRTMEAVSASSRTRPASAAAVIPPHPTPQQVKERVDRVGQLHRPWAGWRKPTHLRPQSGQSVSHARSRTPTLASWAASHDTSHTSDRGSRADASAASQLGDVLLESGGDVIDGIAAAIAAAHDGADRTAAAVAALEALTVVFASDSGFGGLFRSLFEALKRSSYVDHPTLLAASEHDPDVREAVKAATDTHQPHRGLNARAAHAVEQTVVNTNWHVWVAERAASAWRTCTRHVDFAQGPLAAQHQLAREVNAIDAKIALSRGGRVRGAPSQAAGAQGADGPHGSDRAAAVPTAAPPATMGSHLHSTSDHAALIAARDSVMLRRVRMRVAFASWRSTTKGLHKMRRAIDRWTATTDTTHKRAAFATWCAVIADRKAGRRAEDLRQSVSNFSAERARNGELLAEVMRRQTRHESLRAIFAAEQATVRSLRAELDSLKSPMVIDFRRPIIDGATGREIVSGSVKFRQHKSDDPACFGYSDLFFDLEHDRASHNHVAANAGDLHESTIGRAAAAAARSHYAIRVDEEGATVGDPTLGALTDTLMATAKSSWKAARRKSRAQPRSALSSAPSASGASTGGGSPWASANVAASDDGVGGVVESTDAGAALDILEQLGAMYGEYASARQERFDACWAEVERLRGLRGGGNVTVNVASFEPAAPFALPDLEAVAEHPELLAAVAAAAVGPQCLRAEIPADDPALELIDGGGYAVTAIAAYRALKSVGCLGMVALDALKPNAPLTSQRHAALRLVCARLHAYTLLKPHVDSVALNADVPPQLRAAPTSLGASANPVKRTPLLVELSDQRSGLYHADSHELAIVLRWVRDVLQTQLPGADCFGDEGPHPSRTGVVRSFGYDLGDGLSLLVAVMLRLSPIAEGDGASGAATHWLSANDLEADRHDAAEWLLRAAADINVAIPAFVSQQLHRATLEVKALFLAAVYCAVHAGAALPAYTALGADAAPRVGRRRSSVGEGLGTPQGGVSTSFVGSSTSGAQRRQSTVVLTTPPEQALSRPPAASPPGSICAAVPCTASAKLAPNKAPQSLAARLVGLGPMKAPFDAPFRVVAHAWIAQGLRDQFVRRALADPGVLPRPHDSDASGLCLSAAAVEQWLLPAMRSFLEARGEAGQIPMSEAQVPPAALELQVRRAWLQTAHMTADECRTDLSAHSVQAGAVRVTGWWRTVPKEHAAAFGRTIPHARGATSSSSIGSKISAARQRSAKSRVASAAAALAASPTASTAADAKPIEADDALQPHMVIELLLRVAAALHAYCLQHACIPSAKMPTWAACSEFFAAAVVDLPSAPAPGDAAALPPGVFRASQAVADRDYCALVRAVCVAPDDASAALQRHRSVLATIFCVASVAEKKAWVLPEQRALARSRFIGLVTRWWQSVSVAGDTYRNPQATSVPVAHRSGFCAPPNAVLVAACFDVVCVQRNDRALRDQPSGIGKGGKALSVDDAVAVAVNHKMTAPAVGTPATRPDALVDSVVAYAADRDCVSFAGFCDALLAIIRCAFPVPWVRAVDAIEAFIAAAPDPAALAECAVSNV